MVSFTPRPIYLQGKRPWYPLNRRLGGPQSRSGRGGEEKNYQPLPGLGLPIIQCYVKSRLMRWVGHVARMSEMRSAYIPPGRPRRRRKDNIRMDVMEIRRGILYWVHLTQDKDQWWVL
jgi:hypothetical protein